MKAPLVTLLEIALLNTDLHVNHFKEDFHMQLLACQRNVHVQLSLDHSGVFPPFFQQLHLGISFMKGHIHTTAYVK